MSTVTIVQASRRPGRGAQYPRVTCFGDNLHGKRMQLIKSESGMKASIRTLKEITENSNLNGIQKNGLTWRLRSYLPWLSVTFFFSFLRSCHVVTSL